MNNVYDKRLRCLILILLFLMLWLIKGYINGICYDIILYYKQFKY